MVTCVRTLLLTLLLVCLVPQVRAADGRFDLVGPKIDVRVTRGSQQNQQTLPIASVPNLQPGDRLWIHPDLPASQSVKYLLICVFLRGTTNPPPESWFTRVETWKKEVREEGVFITVPPEAEQTVLFMAPETGGDFATLKSAVRGRPGVFVRASQDLNEAGFEQARIERYVADIRRVPPSDSVDLQRRSDFLARTLALKPNADCFKRPVDQQFTCLTQTGTQTLLDDGHGENIVSSLSNGPNSDFIQAASYMGIAGAGVYSAYVGAIVDLVRIMGNLHTAQYQYIPAIAFPQGDALNLRLNTPPSFHNPKSVLVVGLPSIQPAQTPPLRPADANETACLLKPRVVLSIEGAPLVFSTDFATSLVLHLNTPPGTPAEPDIPLAADAFEGGLVLQRAAEHHLRLHDVRPLIGGNSPSAPPSSAPTAATVTAPPATATPATGASATRDPDDPRELPVTLTGTVQGRWGFDSFVGPTVRLQQLPGDSWRVVNVDGAATDLIAGKSEHLFLASTGSACVHAVTADLPNSTDAVPLHFREDTRPEHPTLISVDLPAGRRIVPGNLHLQITQFGQPQPNAVAAQTFADPPHLAGVVLPAGDRSMLLTGTNLASIQRITLGDLVFQPAHPAAAAVPDSGDAGSADGGEQVRFSLSADAPPPPTHAGDKLAAQVTLFDGRHLPLSFSVLPPRPSVALMSHNSDPLPGSALTLSNADDLPLAAHLTFTLKSRSDFPRNGRIEVETSDGTLRSVLTLAPAGGLVLQDPHTVVASLDPLRSFGPSAFGALRLRAVFPGTPAKTRRPADADTSPGGAEPAPTLPGDAALLTASLTASQTVSQTPPQTAEDSSRESDWLPLGTLVRLPTLLRLQCNGEAAAPCNLSGANLFLIQSISADPAFATFSTVPDGFTGSTLPVPHPATAAATFFVKLRDDPGAVNSASVAISATTNQASTARGHVSSTHN